MGEFLLGMAQDRKHQAGVEADIMVRQGSFREALADVISEKEVESLVIGKSSEGEGITTEGYLTILANTVREKGVEMLVVEAGKLVRRYTVNDGDTDLPA